MDNYNAEYWVFIAYCEKEGECPKVFDYYTCFLEKVHNGRSPCSFLVLEHSDDIVTLSLEDDIDG